MEVNMGIRSKPSPAANGILHRKAVDRKIRDGLLKRRPTVNGQCFFAAV
jgi:hypothetical protein